MNSPLFHRLRQRHPRLRYDSFQIETPDAGLHISWKFILENGQDASKKLIFQPTLSIPAESATELAKIPSKTLHNLVFQLGLVELISYWKAACPPEIVIEAGFLNQDQLDWWQQLLIGGLGEFFYTNGIDFTQPDLVNWLVPGAKPPKNHDFSLNLNPEQYIVPLGGGKDSAVTAELIKQALHSAQLSGSVQYWGLNPIPASQATAQILGGPLHQLKRTIDPQLLELNQQGYLNGHTPLSAYLAFGLALAAAISGSQYALVSNEASASECNAIYKGHEINHQYSKSYQFEQAFQAYSQQYLLPEYRYLSFLRPWHELQIARQFSQLPQHFETFRSCNRGQKLNHIWCHDCPKCLFAFVMLFPFIETDVLTSQIFNQNLFDQEKLVETALKLVLPDKEKPFECVGSYQESKLAFWAASHKYAQQNLPLPVILEIISDQVLSKHPNSYWQNQWSELLASFDPNHSLPPELAAILKAA